MSTHDLKNLCLLGASYKTACANSRKALYIPEESIRRLTQDVKARIPGAEFLLLSTCNRVEFYLFSNSGCNPQDELVQIIGAYCPSFSALVAQGAVFVKHQVEAMMHLLRVVCGLESSIVGDMQIVQQVRRSLQTAREYKTSGQYIEATFGKALSLGSLVRSETEISAGGAGITSSAVHCVETWLQQGSHKSPARVLILGLGLIGHSLAKQLSLWDDVVVSIANRTDEKAASLARDLCLSPVPWSAIHDAVTKRDCVIAAANAPAAILHWKTLPTTERPNCKNKLWIDLGMPSNLDQGFYEHCDVMGIDSVRGCHSSIYERREKAAELVERYIDSALDEWLQWLNNRPLESVLKSLYMELDRCSTSLATRIGGDEFCRQNMRIEIERTFKKLLHPHIAKIRKHSQRPTMPIE